MLLLAALAGLGAFSGRNHRGDPDPAILGLARWIKHMF